ncbi:39S ribosomal protein L47, mitochondrial [Camponotus floridanus]|uniref:Large ribosomal subunit protein uL29m n=1 Tax=Camponotus floridanus TaxID=104421 RepID=E2AMP1_CAMFO|nr:39S ribosomal protein L47, mitochondrial [Camponotus floridanus]EFN65309.1 39S ribosomal protein L47, mitochondrial [Camponotus floridanus]
MAALMKAVHVSKNMNNIMKLFTNLSLTPNVITSSKHVFLHRTPALHCAFIHITPDNRDLMEFFDEPKNWGRNEVKVGRSWRKDELRLKSNSDLHKLWYVLLKERNMLMTMEEVCKDENKIFPNPERLDKVKDSMNNLESVVRERNRAYHMLETGETGERPGKLVYNCLGLKFYHRMHQYIIPKYMNRKWHKWHKFGFGGFATRRFLRLYREKIWNQKRRARNRDKNRVAVLMSKFPNVDIEAVKQHFPNVDLETIKTLKRARGHHVPE